MNQPNESKTVVLTGNQIDKARLVILKGMLKLECLGMSRRGVSAYKTVKAELKLKGTKHEVLAQLIKILEVA